MKDNTGLYNFNRLKSFLKSIGYEVIDTAAYKPITIEDIGIEDFKNIHFTNKGIFIKLEDGTTRKMFLYKRNYHLSYGNLPRFHIRKCQTIQNFIDSGSFKKEYRRAETATVVVCDMDNNFKEKKVTGLPICKHCLKLAKKEAFDGMTTKDFEEKIRETVKVLKENEIDLFGYTKDWPQISKKYKEGKKYTCEKCKLHITNSIDKRFIQVHHIDGNKLNNRESNLECLCIRCHSNIDENHYKNFHSGANKVALDFFIKKYGTK